MLNVELYKKMYLCRRAEQEIQKYYSEDEMKTPMHMSMGEEAIVAGVVQNLKPDDQVFGTYRSHALYLMKTGNIDDFFAEMYGKDTALLKGKGGSMHMCNPFYGFMGTSAIVAGIIPAAIGAAWANKQKRNGKIVAVFFGDGAIDEGDFWESLNIACLMKLPILFVCEDNNLAVHTSAKMRHGYKSIAKIVKQFDCNVFESDTGNARVIYKIVHKAIRKMADNEMPCFFHFNYFRYLEHVGINEDFKDGYRPAPDNLWEDPLILQKLSLSDNRAQKIENEINLKVSSSIEKAKIASFADFAKTYVGVFS